jgi:hypothetical protein
MVYTRAYFTTPVDSIDTAKEGKFGETADETVNK